MRILLTNDDGIFAPGIAAIYPLLSEMADVEVVAPDKSRSGASHSITFHGPLICNKVDIKGTFSGYSVQGSPADCVKLACMNLIEEPVDLVVSGVNNGANAGINVYYSGTVAAAMEAAFLRIPAVAVSVAWEEQIDFDLAARYCFDTLKKFLPIQPGYVVNINVPPLSRGKPKGVRVVPQSTEGFHEQYIRKENDDGHLEFHLEGGPHRHEPIAKDTTALAEGYITVSALTADMTDHKNTEALKKHLETLEQS